MTAGELQQQIFIAIKKRIGENLTPADEIAKLLNISADSAYRRMRGENTLSLEELYKLCNHYNISLDQMMDIQTGSIIFLGQYVDKGKPRFEEYVTGLLHQLAYINSFKEKEYFYMCKDLPIFHHYHLREIAAFKWFFYVKTYLEFPKFVTKKFRFSDFPDELFALEQKALNLYNQIPSVEMWNIESMNILFRQIEFYRDGQVFESNKDIYALYEAIGKLWDHLEMQASLGYKFNYGDAEKKRIGDFKMYFNEVLLGDNNSLVILDGIKMSYVSHTTINYMLTRDVAFNENMYNHVQNQMKRSTLISEVSEKERSRFFRITRDKIEHRKESLKI